MLIGVLNYVFWHDQFLKLDSKYNIVFIALPMVIGVVLFYFLNKRFIKNLIATKSVSLWDDIFSYGILILTAVFFAYFSVVTFANVLFKIGMDISTKDKPMINKTYVVESTFKNDTGRGIHLYSDIRYFDDNNALKIFNVEVNEVETSNQSRKIHFKCKEGFWGYYKILDYKME